MICSLSGSEMSAYCEGFAVDSCLAVQFLCSFLCFIVDQHVMKRLYNPNRNSE